MGLDFIVIIIINTSEYSWYIRAVLKVEITGSAWILGSNWKTEHKREE
jgi:hypothetical protein